MADAVKIMSRKDSLIQVETANVHKLTDALQNLLVRRSDCDRCEVSHSVCLFSKEMQDFSDEYMHLLQNSDLTNDNERTMCIQAATLLTQALSVQLQPGTKSIAFETKKNLCFKEWRRCRRFDKDENHSNKLRKHFPYDVEISSVVNLSFM